MVWSSEKVGRLREMWLAGSSSSDIADELGGVSRNAVMGKIHRLGLIGSAAHNAAMKAAPKGCCRPKAVPAVAGPRVDVTPSVSAVSDPEPRSMPPMEAQPVASAPPVEHAASPPVSVAEPEARPGGAYAAFISARLSAKPIMPKRRSEAPAPEEVVLSSGTMSRIVRDPSSTWSVAASFLRDLTGIDFDRRVRGHMPALVGIATIMSRGDPRTILCPRIAEPDVLRLMREMAVNGMVVAGRAPERWLDAETGDAGFWRDMLSLEPGSAIDAGHRTDAFV